MQLLGFCMFLFVVWFGLQARAPGQAITVFDSHAFVIVVMGSCGAMLLASSRRHVWATLKCLRELLPGCQLFARQSAALEANRLALVELWQQGQRHQAVTLVQANASPVLQQMLQLLLQRSNQAQSSSAFLQLRHQAQAIWQPAIGNWEMLAKLGPSFGMIGTITGMIQLFRNMSADELNLGASMSLALVATLYGVGFGAGIAAPVAHFLQSLLDEHLDVLERCEQSIHELRHLGGHQPAMYQAFASTPASAAAATPLAQAS